MKDQSADQTVNEVLVTFQRATVPVSILYLPYFQSDSFDIYAKVNQRERLHSSGFLCANEIFLFHFQ